MTSSEKKSRGICYSCSLPASPGKARCEKHLKALVAINNKYIKTDKGAKRAARSRHLYVRGNGHFNNVRTMAIRRGKVWELTESEWRKLISMPCFYCGCPNDPETGTGLDRLDNTRGYILGNVESCCFECNTARNNLFTVDEMKILGQAIRWIKERRGQLS